MKRPKITVTRSDATNRRNPGLISPSSSVRMESESTNLETDRPVKAQCTTWAVIST
jgi:hypothetical protein